MKNKIIIFIGILLSFGAYAETDYIDMQIMELEQRRDALKNEIAECEKNTKGYKIAGISTIAATGIGVYGNIALHNEIKKIEQSKNGGGGFVGGGGGPQADTRPPEQKANDECQMFCADMPDDAIAMGCEC